MYNTHIYMYILTHSTYIDRPGFVARVPIWLGQAWPFVAGADAAGR
jgi:hypothetical protein